jgi:hypothetical protein
MAGAMMGGSDLPSVAKVCCRNIADSTISSSFIGRSARMMLRGGARCTR